MKIILNISLMFLMFMYSIKTFNAQTQNELINHINIIQNINNEFMSNYLNFYSSSKDANSTKKLSLYFEIINENKKTVENLENVPKVEWDKGLLSSLLIAHKIMGENLNRSKNEFEDLFISNEISNEKILKELLITDELNKFLFKLNNKTEKELKELCNKNNIILKEHPLNKKIQLINERINYSNEVSKIYLPVLIQIEKVLESYNNNDGSSIEKISLETKGTIDVALEKIGQLSKDKSSNELCKLVSKYLNNSKYFIDKRVKYWINYTFLEEPTNQKELDNYNLVVEKANENVEIYNENAVNISLINNAIKEFTNI